MFGRVGISWKCQGFWGLQTPTKVSLQRSDRQAEAASWGILSPYFYDEGRVSWSFPCKGESAGL